MKIGNILEYMDEISIEYRFYGDRNVDIEGFSSLENYKEGTFTWLKGEKYIPDGFAFDKVILIFVPPKLNVNARNLIKLGEPREVFFKVLDKFYGEKRENISEVGKFTYVSPKVVVGENVSIGHNCSIDGEITIGDDTIIQNNVSITGRVAIGKRCEIESGCVIGYENVAYSESDNHKKSRIRQYGGVVIGDDVKIQALVKIARGTIDNTVIEDKAIIGDGSSISHNCHVGENAAMLPFGVLCGSVSIGRNSYLSAAYVRNQISIGENAYVGFGSVVARDVQDNEKVWGFPAKKFPIRR